MSAFVRYLAVVACTVMTAVVLAGCAPTSAYVSARQIETGAAKFVDTAADTWHAYSHARLENIKDACGDLDCFKQTVAQWESGTVVHADQAIATARDAVHVFATTLDAANAVQSKDFSAAIQALISAVTQMINILNGYGLTLALFKVL